MSDPLTLNQRFVLASRPVGAPTPRTFAWSEKPCRISKTARCC